MDYRNYKLLKEGRYQSVGILENTYVFEIKTGFANVPEYYQMPLGARYEVTCPQCGTISSETKD